MTEAFGLNFVQDKTFGVTKQREPDKIRFEIRYPPPEKSVIIQYNVKDGTSAYRAIFQFGVHSDNVGVGRVHKNGVDLQGKRKETTKEKKKQRMK